MKKNTVLSFTFGFIPWAAYHGILLHSHGFTTKVFAHGLVTAALLAFTAWAVPSFLKRPWAKRHPYAGGLMIVGLYLYGTLLATPAFFATMTGNPLLSLASLLIYPFYVALVAFFVVLPVWIFFGLGHGCFFSCFERRSV